MLMIALSTTVQMVAAEPVVKPPRSKTDPWPQFLGPDRNGVSRETGLLKTWPTGGPKELWRVPGGTGMSGFAIARGRALSMVQKEGQQSVVALSAKTGKTIWQTAIGPKYGNSQGAGPRATPTVAGAMVYVFSGEGNLLALKFDDGKIVWQHKVVIELGGKPAPYGMACSPLVVGDLVIVTAGAPGATVVAYDRNTGKLAWKAGGGAAGYSSPALRTIGGRQQVIAFVGVGAMGLDPSSGKLLWKYPFKTDFDCNIATPLTYRGQVFISAAENHGSALLSLKAADGKFDVTETWTSFGPKSALRSEWQTAALVGDHLYGFDNVGSAGPITHLNCVEVATGKRVWQKTRFGKANLIAADGKLFIITFKGELVVVTATAKGYHELGRIKVLIGTRQAPALADGLLYLRDNREFVCLDVRETK